MASSRDTTTQTMVFRVDRVTRILLLDVKHQIEREHGDTVAWSAVLDAMVAFWREHHPA